MINKKHNFSKGKINYCQVCNSKSIKKVMDFGYQPLADDLVKLNQNISKLFFYPLQVYLCTKCTLLQTGYIVGDEILYPKNYHYTPGISKSVVENFKNLSFNISKNYNLNKNDLIVDVGCNDGSLLNEFKTLGFKKLLGVEPTDTVNKAKKKKINVINDFFNFNSSKKALNQFGKAKIIITTNVFAHTDKLGDFLKGINNLIDKDGVFIVENHYLLDVINKNQFDTFYHEHLRTYSLKSLIKLMKYYNLNIINAFTSDRYGGNIQAHFSKRNQIKNMSNVRNILNKENKARLNYEKTYINFFKKIQIAKDNLHKFLKKNKNKKIVGKAFPARASVLIHFFDYLKNFIDTIYEQPSSKKINHYVPGTNIQIKSSKSLKNSNPDIILIFAWHMFNEIKNKWIKRGLIKTKYVKPLPKLKIK